MSRPSRLRLAPAAVVAAGLFFAVPALAALGHAREGAVSFSASGWAGLKIEGRRRTWR